MEYRDLVTVDEVRSFTGWSEDDYSDSAIEEMISSVSIFIEELVGHPFGFSEDTEYQFQCNGSSMIEFYGFEMPLASEPTEIDEMDYSSSAYRLYPQSGAPYEELHSLHGHFPSGHWVKIRADWGWEEVPAAVKRMALRLISRYAEDDSFSSMLSGSSSSSPRRIRKVEIGESKTAVTFNDELQSSQTILSLLDSVSRRVIVRYRRERLGSLV